MAKPKAVTTVQVCSLCGLDWKRHGENPTTDDCIALLRADLAAAERRPVYIPYARPIPWSPYWPYYAPVWGGNSAGRAVSSGGTITISNTSLTPSLGGVPKALIA